MRGMGATECRQAPDDLSAVPEGLLGGFELHVYLGDRAGASKELDAGEGHLEQIVQMMGGAGGELPSGLEGPGTDQVGLGAREVLIGPLYVLIEPGVLKDERRVIGEGLGEGNLVIAKETPLAIPARSPGGRVTRGSTSKFGVAIGWRWATAMPATPVPRGKTMCSPKTAATSAARPMATRSPVSG